MSQQHFSIPLKNTTHNSKLLLFIQIPHNKRLGRIYSLSIGGTTFFKVVQEQNTIFTVTKST
jgi:hypothetical protein